jgi:hypothetical protein
MAYLPAVGKPQQAPIPLADPVDWTGKSLWGLPVSFFSSICQLSHKYTSFVFV